MRRWNAMLVLVLAILVGGQTILHNHPAISAAAGDDVFLSSAQVVPCAICATANARVLVAVPEIVAPAPAVESPVARSVPESPVPSVSPLPSRAPPAQA